MTQATLIARASLAEHSRRRLTLFFLVASVLLTAPLVYLARSPRAAQQLVESPRELAALAALGFLQYLAVFAALATSMGNIGRPFESGEALTILARPVARWQYVLGRLMGSASFVIGFCLALAVETTIVQMVAGDTAAGVVWGHWATTAFNLVVVAAIATVLSAVLSNPVVVAVTAFFAYLTTSTIATVHQLGQTGQLSGGLARFFNIAWLVTPKLLPSPLANEEVGVHVGADMTVPRVTPGLVVAGVAWLVLLAGLAMWLTYRRDV